MAKHPKLDSIKKLMSTGEDIVLTESQYRSKTGVDMPKTSRYLIKNSALSRAAAEYGYTVEVIERTVILKK
ncbi:MAG: hypothetical protein LUD73_05910 [Lachnospiraceae bacterium]|nr:hypothetical protein [Lachnospiraceae bacterium]